jgi:hypothetical protein
MVTNEKLIIDVLAEVAERSPANLHLVAQLLGCEPCPKCDYKKEFCRCKETQSLSWREKV